MIPLAGRQEATGSNPVFSTFGPRYHGGFLLLMVSKAKIVAQPFEKSGVFLLFPYSIQRQP